MRRPVGVWRVALSVTSLTWAYANHQKARRGEPANKTSFIKRMNARYLAVAVCLSILFLVVSWNDVAEIRDMCLSRTPSLVMEILKVALAAYLLSRCNEVFYAFYRDATDKLTPAAPVCSNLRWGERVGLALRSYLELILNFGLLYAMMPKSMWQHGFEPVLFTDTLSYSATTITTSGGGGFAAGHWFAQALTAYEVACGVILLVVCFTVYVGHALAEFPQEWYRDRAVRQQRRDPEQNTEELHHAGGIADAGEMIVEWPGN